MDSEIRFELYEGYTPDQLDKVDSGEIDRDSVDLLQDAAWQVVGEHVASGPADAPYVIEAQVWHNLQTVRVRASVDYIAT